MQSHREHTECVCRLDANFTHDVTELGIEAFGLVMAIGQQEQRLLGGNLGNLLCFPFFSPAALVLSRIPCFLYPSRSLFLFVHTNFNCISHQNLVDILRKQN